MAENGVRGFEADKLLHRLWHAASDVARECRQARLAMGLAQTNSERELHDLLHEVGGGWIGEHDHA